MIVPARLSTRVPIAMSTVATTSAKSTIMMLVVLLNEPTANVARTPASTQAENPSADLRFTITISALIEACVGRTGPDKRPYDSTPSIL